LVDALFVEDGDHEELAEGAATIARELDSLDVEIDAVFVPIGRGSLAYGMGSWLHQSRPRVRVVGVGASRAPGTVHSVRQRRLVAAPITPGLAPELSVAAPAERTVVPLSEALDDTALVDDRHLSQAAAALLDHEGIRASNDGAAALAAAALAASGIPGATVVVPVTGRIVS
jgi:threonine dehydratase